MNNRIVKTRKPRNRTKKEAGSKTTDSNLKDNNSTNKAQQEKRPIAVNSSLIGKPSSAEVAKHQHKFEVIRLTPRELHHSVCKQGFAFMPAVMNGKRSKQNFKSASYIAIDIDGGVKLEDVLKDPFIRKTACFIYTTASHGKDGQDRFRIVWELESEIVDYERYEELAKALISKYGADPACSDASRFFFGNSAETCKSHRYFKTLDKKSIEALLQEYTPREISKCQQNPEERTNAFAKSIPEEEIRKMLGSIPDKPGYNTWMVIIFAVKAWAVANKLSDAVVKKLVNGWSPDYKTDGKEIDKLLREYKPGQTGIGTLIYHAASHGYKLPEHLIRLRTPGQVAEEDLFNEEDYITVGNYLHRYNGKYYEQLSDGELMKRMLDYFKTYVTDFGKNKTGYASNKLAKEALDYIKSTNWIPPEKFNPPGINVKNGYLRLYYNDEGQPQWSLEEHSPSQYFTYVADFEYDPKAKGEEVKKALLDALDSNQAGILLKIISAVFDIDHIRKVRGRDLRALILHGDGANGKDTTNSWTQSLLGYQGITHVPIQSFRTADNGKTSVLLSLVGSKLNWASENDPKLLDKSSTLKSFITGESFEIDPKYRDTFNFKPRSVCIFNTNEEPVFSKLSKAFSTRFAILKFKNVFVSNPDPSKDWERLANPKLKDDPEYIKNEILPGFLRLLMGAYKALIRDGIDYTLVDETKTDLILQNNHLYRFNDDCIEGLSESFEDGTTMADLFECYKQWCSDEGLMELGESGSIIRTNDSSSDKVHRSPASLSKAFTDIYPNVKRDRVCGMRYIGLTLR